MLGLRIGHGYDVHAFGGEGPIVIGGVKIDFDRGLLAHSDGDVALHALCDAILGAIGAGDIGQHFPDTDPTFMGADSSKLLLSVYKLANERGFYIGNIDITVIAQAPKLSPHIPQMVDKISATLGIERTQVNVKATTTEKLGFCGRKEGIATHAVVLMTSEENR